MAINNGATTLAVAITTTAQTTVQVAAGKGANFANGNYAILYNAGVIELVLVTGIAGDVLTVTRGQGGTTAATWPIGTSVTTGATGAGLNDMMNQPIATFKAGATMVGDVNMAIDPTADLHAVRKSWVDANYYPASQPYQTALGFTPIERGWDAHTVGIGWNGNLYVYVDSVYRGYMWTSNNFNPGAKANKYAQVPWASGIWEVGKTDADAAPGSQVTIDAGAPWCAEGARSNPNGDFQWYLRVVWLRNQ